VGPASGAAVIWLLRPPAAVLASRLGLPELSVIEFGVAGGRGLVALEQLAAEIGPAVGVRIAV